MWGKFNSATCNLNKQCNNKTCQYGCKNYHKCRKDYSWIPSTCICENSKYLRSIADTSVMECERIITVMGIVSTKMTIYIAANVMSTALINFQSKK